MPARVVIVMGVLVAVGCNGDSERAKESEQPIVLARATLPGGRHVEIRSHRDATGPCLTIVGLPRGPRQCGRAPSESVPPGPVMTSDAIAQVTPRSRIELYGATRPAVRQVSVEFGFPSGCPASRSAFLIPVTDVDALRAAGISEPFAYFIAFVPSHARDVVAIGRTAHGNVLRQLEYDPIVDSLHAHTFIARERKGSTNR